MTEDTFQDIYKNKSRKCKVLRIPQHAVLNLLCHPAEMNAIYRLDLPEDVKVVRAWVDHEYRAISFLLESELFEEVEEGYRAPEIEFRGVDIVKYKVENVND